MGNIPRLVRCTSLFLVSTGRRCWCCIHSRTPASDIIASGDFEALGGTLDSLMTIHRCLYWTTCILSE